MALRGIAGRRSAVAASCPGPRDLPAPCPVRIGETAEHYSAKRSADSDRPTRSVPRTRVGTR